MIQIIEYILMGIGALSIIYWCYKIVTSFGTALDAGFRNQFPTDYLCCLSEVTGLFEQHGSTKGNLINAGSDKPGIKKNKGENSVEIYLDAPLDENLPSEIGIVFLKQSFKIRIPTRMSNENRMLLSRICTIMNI
jgi:hypothetical protein